MLCLGNKGWQGKFEEVVRGGDTKLLTASICERFELRNENELIMKLSGKDGGMLYKKIVNYEMKGDCKILLFELAKFGSWEAVRHLIALSMSCGHLGYCLTLTNNDGDSILHLMIKSQKSDILCKILKNMVSKLSEQDACGILTKRNNQGGSLIGLLMETNDMMVLSSLSTIECNQNQMKSLQSKQESKWISMGKGLVGLSESKSNEIDFEGASMIDNDNDEKKERKEKDLGFEMYYPFDYDYNVSHKSNELNESSGNDYHWANRLDKEVEKWEYRDMVTKWEHLRFNDHFGVETYLKRLKKERKRLSRARINAQWFNMDENEWFYTKYNDFMDWVIDNKESNNNNRLVRDRDYYRLCGSNTKCRPLIQDLNVRSNVLSIRTNNMTKSWAGELVTVAWSAESLLDNFHCDKHANGIIALSTFSQRMKKLEKVRQMVRKQLKYN